VALIGVRNVAQDALSTEWTSGSKRGHGVTSAGSRAASRRELRTTVSSQRADDSPSRGTASAYIRAASGTARYSWPAPSWLTLARGTGPFVSCSASSGSS
jgi:hypothetical protein